MPHDDRCNSRQQSYAGSAQQPYHMPTGAYGTAEAAGAEVAEHEELYSKWRESIVAFAKPILRGPYERNEINKEDFKQILKKTTEKVIGSYRKEGVLPPENFEIAGSARAKIQKLVEDYVAFIQKA